MEMFNEFFAANFEQSLLSDVLLPLLPSDSSSWQSLCDGGRSTLCKQLFAGSHTLPRTFNFAKIFKID